LKYARIYSNKNKPSFKQLRLVESRKSMSAHLHLKMLSILSRGFAKIKENRENSKRQNL
jgi:hypothetical protein